ncbi:hypothetical protein MO867_04570 [Microbulbifer sp. OS29]|uniref:Uncharacterized protein n=1 Tax=Microbulbifer okhotskensis TaxID=2926617 RepID=A0A9X2EL69_9GAMM|nr:hypothetical protein [Microbulbifer okhotskensis]MCO1333610.1 hypothetical protein [Microbulbifer okhotskensis]
MTYQTVSSKNNPPSLPAKVSEQQLTSLENQRKQGLKGIVTTLSGKFEERDHCPEDTIGGIFGRYAAASTGTDSIAAPGKFRE